MTVCMAYFVLAIVLQVLFRHVFKISAAWTDETARYSFIWMMFLGFAVATKKGTHVSADILQALFKNKKLKQNHQKITKVVFLIFSMATTIVGVKVCLSLQEFPQRSSVLEISMLWVYISMPIGMGLTTIRLIQSFFKKGSDDELTGEIAEAVQMVEAIKAEEGITDTEPDHTNEEDN